MVELNNTTKARIDSQLMIRAARKFLAARKLAGKDVSIALVSDKKIRELNRLYRKKDKATDVLSFSGEGQFLGEIVICLKEVKRQAKEAGRSDRYELIFILIHGLLHLSGLDDRTEKERLKMIKLGEDLIKKLCLV